MLQDFVWFDSLRPINNLSVIKGRAFLGWTSAKLGLMFLLKDTTQWRRSHGPLDSSQALYHWATALPMLRRYTTGDRIHALKLKHHLICFISIAPLPACKISAKNLTTALVIEKFKYLTFVGSKGWGKILTLPCFIYREWAIMVYSKKLLNIKALRKCEDYYTKKLI